MMTLMPPRLILASSSPQRKELLTKAGYQFEIVPPDEAAEECGICSTGGPAALVMELALRKAADVARQIVEATQQFVPSIIIACDTVAECQGAILGKPRDEEHAREMLDHLRGERQRVLSGLCIWPMLNAKPLFEELAEQAGFLAGSPKVHGPQMQLAVTELEMDPISDADLEEYLASGLWQGKAGAFGYQDRHGWLRILAGSESNVIGLPMELLEEQLESVGYSR